MRKTIITIVSTYLLLKTKALQFNDNKTCIPLRFFRYFICNSLSNCIWLRITQLTRSSGRLWGKGNPHLLLMKLKTCPACVKLDIWSSNENFPSRILMLPLRAKEHLTKSPMPGIQILYLSCRSQFSKHFPKHYRILLFLLIAP